MFSLLLHPAPDQEDYLVADLSEHSVLGISEEPGGLRAFFDDQANRPDLIRRFAPYQPELHEEPAVDWVQTVHDAWPPLEVGRRFFLVAPWSQEAAPPGRLRLEIEPGMACGTGRHPATQLCLEALERHLKPGVSVLDIGTGSAILSRAAQLLSASRVAGCDIDPEAIAFSHPRTHLPLFVGSAGAVRSQSQDLIVANIDAATIEALAPEIARVRKPDATLILSGFPDWDLPQGFHAKESLSRERWVCLVC